MSAKRKGLLGHLPILRELGAIRDSLSRIEASLAAQTALLQNQYLDWQLAANPRYQDPRRLNGFERQVYSQNGEDGVIAEIFRRIGTRAQSFIEIGVGDGLENNTTHLLLQGWNGCWIEGDKASVSRINKTFAAQLSCGQLRVRNEFVTAENILGLLNEAKADLEPDLLSVDVDRNTWFIWEALGAVKARLVVVEYNALYPPPERWKVEYRPEKTWNGTACFGASLKEYEELGRKLGYALVGCEFFGANAFFVRSDLAKDRFSEPFTAEHHYEPPRYWLARREGHPRCVSD